MCRTGKPQLILLSGFGIHSLGNFRTVQQLDQCHRRIVALTEAELQDTGVAARAGRETRAQFREQLGDHVAIAQAGECQTTVGNGVLLGQRDQRLDNFAQFLGLRQGGLDQLVLQQRVGHVAQHRETVRRGAVQFPQTMTVTHDDSFLRVFDQLFYHPLRGAGR